MGKSVATVIWVWTSNAVEGRMLCGGRSMTTAWASGKYLAMVSTLAAMAGFLLKNLTGSLDSKA